MYGGAPMYVDRLREAVKVFGRIFVQGFAQGEAPMGCTCLSKDEHDIEDAAAEHRLGSAGRECCWSRCGSSTKPTACFPREAPERSSFA